MKRIATAIVFALTPAGVLADFTGVTCEPYLGEGWAENEYAGLTTYRLYAEFDDPTDVLYAIGGSDKDIMFDPSGGTFYNAPVFDSLTAPIDLRFGDIWNNQWDTYVTIGKDTAEGDETTLSPGFAKATGNLQGPFSGNCVLWFVTPDAEQARPVGGRVLLAQLTVPVGDTVSGLVNVFAIIDGKLVEFPGQLFECVFADCNDNGLPDALEIAKGLSNDCDGNGVPDKCDDEPCLRADLDCSGDVDFADMLPILKDWGPCEACTADIDDDGRIGNSDLIYVLAQWGACTP